MVSFSLNKKRKSREPPKRAIALNSANHVHKMWTKNQCFLA
jgi:hypothetical protein